MNVPHICNKKQKNWSHALSRDHINQALIRTLFTYLFEFSLENIDNPERNVFKNQFYTKAHNILGHLILSSPPKVILKLFEHTINDVTHLSTYLLKLSGATFGQSSKLWQWWPTQSNIIRMLYKVKEEIIFVINFSFITGTKYIILHHYPPKSSQRPSMGAVQEPIWASFFIIFMQANKLVLHQASSMIYLSRTKALKLELKVPSKYGGYPKVQLAFIFCSNHVFYGGKWYTEEE